jgi:hypothetical protein
VADFAGKYRYLEQAGGSLQEGACRVQFDAQTFTLTPDSGAPLAFDLGDIDAVVAAEWEVRLALYTGRSIVLRQFAKAYDALAQSLTGAYRERAIRCLLLEDMTEVARFDGQFELIAAGAATRAGPAEIRIYKSNLAVLATSTQPFQWRLADIDTVRFDAANYAVVLESGGAQLKVLRLAKRTEEFTRCVRDAKSAVAASGAQALHAAFPFLDPDRLQSTAALLREGRAAPVAKLAQIDTRIPAALAANAVDQDLQPYYERLLAHTADAYVHAGFKLIRPEEDAAGGGESPPAAASDADATGPQSLYWFFFPLAAKPGAARPVNVIAWEACSREGRATYLFRLVDPAQSAQLQDPATAATVVDAAVRSLNRGLALLNFRRRPIYLSDDELAMDPRYHRYAIAARRIADLRNLRTNFLGRAIHTTPDAWQAQVDAIIEKAG